MFAASTKQQNIFDAISLGLSTSIQSSTVVTLQDGQALPQEAELPSAEVVPVVAPPSLQEVQQAMQEASEQVEGRGAEEVLKELLERVVEAALGQVEGGGEAKADEAGEQGTQGDEKGETESDTEAVEEEAKGKDMADKGRDTDVEEEHEVGDVNAYEDVAEAEKGVVEGKVETAAGPVEETTADVETGGREAEEVEVIDESLDTKVIHEVVEETLVALEEMGGYATVEEAGVDDNKRQVELLEGKGVAEPNAQEEEETPADVEVAVGSESELETGLESDASLAVEEKEGEVMVPPSDNYEMETTQTVVGEPVEQEEEVNIVKDGEGLEVEDEQGHLVVEGGAAEEVQAATAETEGSERHVIKEESVALVNEGLGDQQAGEEEQIALETSHGSKKEDQGEKWFISQKCCKNVGNVRWN